MKKTLGLIIFVGILFCGDCVGAADLFEDIKSSDASVRASAFAKITITKSDSGRIEYDCEFDAPDKLAAKKAVIALLRQEEGFDFENFYRNKYSVRFSKMELPDHVEDPNVRDYLYAMEGFGEYLAELKAFVDSCEDEAAIDLFPGKRTFNKFPKESVDVILSKLGTGKNGGDDNKPYLIRQMGKWAKQYGKNDARLYDKVKNKLIALVEDEDLGNVSVATMGEIGDPAFAAILNKVSQYPGNKGKVKVGRGGRKKIYPISQEAKEALKKLRK